MVFPVRASVTEYTETGDVSTHPVTMPGTRNSGDLCIMIGCHSEIAPVLSAGPSGWTLLADDRNFNNSGVAEGYINFP